MASIACLPPEIIGHIATYLSSCDVVHFGATNRRHLAICTDVLCRRLRSVSPEMVPYQPLVLHPENAQARITASDYVRWEAEHVELKSTDDEMCEYYFMCLHQRRCQREVDALRKKLTAAGTRLKALKQRHRRFATKVSQNARRAALRKQFLVIHANDIHVFNPITGRPAVHQSASIESLRREKSILLCTEIQGLCRPRNEFI